MLHPDQALAQILKHCSILPLENFPLRSSAGRTLGETLLATDNLPRFDNSAMDGYALKYSDIRNTSALRPVTLKIIGEIHAGTHPRIKVRSGTAVRISTGAPIPHGADTVVMQEDCERNGLKLRILAIEPKGGNIRKQGEEIRKGQLALKRGSILNPGSLAWLNTMGTQTVKVVRPVKVGLLRSGNEVVERGKVGRFQIRDAHGISIPLALSTLNAQVKVTSIVTDRLDKVCSSIRAAFIDSDVVITTGGVSVGDRDLFMDAARILGIRSVFHKIAQRPGKPMAFGTLGKKLWFGLPGNPVSALVCFYVYVQPGLQKMMGRQTGMASWQPVRLAQGIKSDPHKTIFFRAKVNACVATLAENQGSHCLGGFSEANVILRINPSPSRIVRHRATALPIVP